MENWKSKLEYYINLANNFFTVPRAYIASHINDNSNVVTKEDSLNRIIWLTIMFEAFLCCGLCFLIFLVFFISSTEYQERYEIDKTTSKHPTQQYMQVIYGDGYSLILQMDKNFDLKIVKTNKYNYNQCGFFAFPSNDNLQTIVGSPGKLNYIHDFHFNSKKISGNFMDNFLKIKML